MRVQTGLERLFDDPEYTRLVAGRRVGLLVNPTSVDGQLRHAIDRAVAAGWDLRMLFGPEHGVRGEAQDMESVEESVDPISRLPCVSLYGSEEATLRPKAAHLADLDVLVIDLQDIGARYYTYIYTAAFCMQACGEAGVDVIVCDRPNPIGGEVVEGNLVEAGYRSFVGAWPLPTRHGMTFGELARYFQAHGAPCALTVAPMQGWRRGMWFDETGLPWVLPSPNMPTLDTAAVYPGQCLLEGTNLSEGRGTTRPFELFGAPWIDAPALQAAVEARGLPGLATRPVSFRPRFQKHAGVTCAGLQLHLTERRAVRSLSASLAILQDVRRLHPDELAWRTDAYEFVADRLAIDLLLGDPLLRHAVEDQTPLEEIEASMAAARAPFEAERQAWLMY